MKYIVKFFVITFFVFYFTHTFAEEKIVFINMDLLLNESKAGKSAQNQLEKHHKSNLDYLMKIQNRLKEEEKDILSKKNILKQEEFEAKINKLREDAKEYQNSRVKLTNELTQKIGISRLRLYSTLSNVFVWTKYSGFDPDWRHPQYRYRAGADRVA